MFHITIAIARFFEILLFDMAKSVAGLLAFGVIVMLGCVAGLAGLFKLFSKLLK